MKTLILGMGNPFLRDDAVGIRLAREIRGRIGDVPDVTFIEECSVGGLNILETVSGFDRLILLDSVQTDSGNPGDVYTFDGRSLRETMNLRNVHDTNLATAMELGRRLGHKVPDPDRVHVFAVEIEDNLTFDERMTDSLEEALPALSSEIEGGIRKLLAERE